MSGVGLKWFENFETSNFRGFSSQNSQCGSVVKDVSRYIAVYFLKLNF